LPFHEQQDFKINEQAPAAEISNVSAAQQNHIVPLQLPLHGNGLFFEDKLSQMSK